jgi:hypothetical protein
MGDLSRIGWRLKNGGRNAFQFAPPSAYGKETIRAAMAHARNEILDRNATWCSEKIELARENLASGSDVLSSEIVPSIEICETPEQHDLFRILRFFWSSPASDYVGRRVRLLIRDQGIKGSPVIGIAALGSSIIHIPDRDDWIGWDTQTRSNRIIYMMDAYVLGALPPYNQLLGGKLVSYILASNEVRELYRSKYLNVRTLLRGRKASDLVLIMTTSLFGKNASQYNRLRYGKSLLYVPIGETAGYGSLHISSDTFEAMRILADCHGYDTSNRFGMGPNWRMRVIRAACDILGLNSDVILRHSFRRGLYALPLARNFKPFLRGESAHPLYRALPMSKLVQHWKDRWCNMRLRNASIVAQVAAFEPKQFKLR